MNLVYVFSRDWPQTQAGISFATYTCYGLAECSNKNNINLVVPKNTEKDYKQVLKDYFAIKEPPENLRVHLLSNETRLSKTTKFYINAVRKIIELNKKEKIDVVISRVDNFIPYLYLIKKLLGVKVFYESHNFHLDCNIKDKPRKKTNIYHKLFLPHINGIICLQNVMKELYQRYLPDQNYCVARTGIKEIVSLDDSWNNEYIAYIGDLSEHKGVKDIFYALKEIKNKNLKLLIIGGTSPEQINEYLNLAEELAVRDRVEITGWVARDSLEDYLKKVKIGIVPIRDNFHNRYLTSPIKIFNYFSHGIPVIASDLPPNREIITDKAGLFYKIGDTKGLASAIDHLSSSPKVYKRYSDFILNKAEGLLWEKRGETILNFINEC